jgi:hypothetical protein
VPLLQIENRVDSIENRQEKEREEKDQRRSDKRRAATALLRQQVAMVSQRPTGGAIAPPRAVPPRPPAKRPPSIPRAKSHVVERSDAGGEDSDDGNHQQHNECESGSDGDSEVARKPLPAFPTGTGRRAKAMTTYIPLSQSSELLLQLAEMELQERQLT